MNLLRIRVIPRSSRTKVQRMGGEAKVWVTAPPVEGEANQAVLRALADALGVKPASLRLAQGQAGRVKVIDLGDLPLAEALIRLPEA